MRIFIFFTAIVFTVSCNDEKTVVPKECEWTGPIEDLPVVASLKASITNCTCIQSVITGTYEEQTVFYVAGADPLCNFVFAPTLYNCEGEVVRIFKGTMEDYNEFFEKVTDITTLYSCTK